LNRRADERFGSALDVCSPCVTYNHDNTYQWFRPPVKKFEDDSGYDPADWMAAMGKSLLWGDEIPIGKFFERNDVPSLHGAEPVLDAGPLAHAAVRISRDLARAFVEELM
jgi:2-oxoglutarate ferredoxin oxidoreductase subunit beta